jgi:hypothetical protein
MLSQRIIAIARGRASSAVAVRSLYVPCARNNFQVRIELTSNYAYSQRASAHARIAQFHSSRLLQGMY